MLQLLRSLTRDISLKVVALLLAGFLWVVAVLDRTYNVRVTVPVVSLRPRIGWSPAAAFWTGLEEALIAADVGVAASVGIVARVREAAMTRPGPECVCVAPKTRESSTGRPRRAS